jgi:hypothetical protein
MKVIRKEILTGAIAVFAVLCICAALLYFMLVRPRAQQLADVEARLAIRLAEEDSLSADKMSKLIAQADKKRAELSEYMVFAGQQGELSIRLRQLASANRLDGFSAKETQGVTQDNDQSSIVEQRTHVLFAGDYSGFAGFAYALEANKPVVFVDGFKVVHNQDDPTRVNVDIDATVLTEGRKR